MVPNRNQCSRRSRGRAAVWRTLTRDRDPKLIGAGRFWVVARWLEHIAEWWPGQSPFGDLTRRAPRRQTGALWESGARLFGVGDVPVARLFWSLAESASRLWVVARLPKATHTGSDSPCTPAHGRTLCRRMSRIPDQASVHLVQCVLIVARRGRDRSVTRAVARQACACDLPLLDPNNAGAECATTRIQAARARGDESNAAPFAEFRARFCRTTHWDGIVTESGSGRPVGDQRDWRHEAPPDPHYRHRFPAEIISHAVWLYHVFSLSLRDVELLLAQRGIVLSYETVRRWCKKFGQSFANRLRRRRPRPGDRWHVDEFSHIVMPKQPNASSDGC